MKFLTLFRTLVIVGVLTGISLGQTATTQESPKETPAAPGPTNLGAVTRTPVASTTPSAPPRAHFVPVLISATDAAGNPALGLTKEQLAIMDTNHAVEPLKIFKGEDIPLHLAIVLLAAPGTFSQQQVAAIGLVQRVVPSENR